DFVRAQHLAVAIEIVGIFQRGGIGARGVNVVAGGDVIGRGDESIGDAVAHIAGGVAEVKDIGDGEIRVCLIGQHRHLQPTITDCVIGEVDLYAVGAVDALAGVERDAAGGGVNGPAAGA